MNITFPDAKRLVVCGDIHGDFEDMTYRSYCLYGMTDTLIIVAGDCGFGFYRPAYYEALYIQLVRRLEKANNWVVFVRGNHDDPSYFDGEKVNCNRLKAVPDYSVLNACGHTILCVGGAISVDRSLRWYQNRIVYWPDEGPVYDQERLEAISEVYDIDTVITHTAPSFCEKISRAEIQNWLIKDIELLDDLKYERKAMDRLHAYLIEHGHPLQQWFYGHFHESWYSEIEGVRYHMLDVMEMKEIQ